jgi:hypothetical protein
MIKKIEEAVRKVTSDPDEAEDAHRDTAWTRGIKYHLGQLGQSAPYKYKVYSTSRGFAADDRELLYDQCWVEVDSDGRFVRLPLVMECEWSGLQDIWRDFRKLLLANADLRLMIFQRDSRIAVGNLFDEMTDEVRRFKGTPLQKFLLCGWANKPAKAFTFRSINT